MNENTFVGNFFIHFNIFLSYFFLFFLHFFLLHHFKINKCIVKSMIPTFLEMQLKKKTKKCFLGTRVWVSKPVYWSPKQPVYVTACQTSTVEHFAKNVNSYSCSQIKIIFPILGSDIMT